MARTWYHDFIAEAREEFDLSYSEAMDYYRDLKEQGFNRQDFIDLALEVFEEPEIEEPEVDWFDDLEYAEYDIEDVEDYWLDEGEEIEITADLEYKETD